MPMSIVYTRNPPARAVLLGPGTYNTALPLKSPMEQTEASAAVADATLYTKAATCSCRSGCCRWRHLSTTAMVCKNEAPHSVCVYLRACKYGLPAMPTLSLCSAHARLTAFTSVSGPAWDSTRALLQKPRHAARLLQLASRCAATQLLVWEPLTQPQRVL